MHTIPDSTQSILKICSHLSNHKITTLLPMLLLKIKNMYTRTVSIKKYCKTVILAFNGGVDVSIH